jgi:hypothetical protein
LIFVCVCLAAGCASAQTNLAARAEKIRAECIQGRRYVCGRVLQITPAGLVVDSGYPSLLQPPLNRSWLTRANVAPARPAVLVEGAEPDAIAVGLVFLTDLPKRPAIRRDIANTSRCPVSPRRFADFPAAWKRLCV